MNIVTLTYGGRTVVRPDTTWEKDNEDLFVPEFVDCLTFTPVVFARISKPGRSIGRSFVHRYFEKVGCGILLYPEDFISGGAPEGFAQACCLDHTSFLPGELAGKDAVWGGDFVASADGREFFRSPLPPLSVIEDGISEVSRFCYLRIGDLVAVEIAGRMELCRRDSGSLCHIVAGNAGNAPVLDFNIHF